MKKAALFVSGLLLSALACAPAMAEVVRVKITARVSSVSDPIGQLNGKVVLGQRLSGTYVYNTNTPNMYPNPDYGMYQPYANEARVRLAAGGWVFESNQPTQGIIIEINAQTPGSGYFDFWSQDNKPLSNGVGVVGIHVNYQGTGSVTQSAALPAVAPTLSDYYVKEVGIYGDSSSGSGFQLTAQIESAELITTDTVQVSPAAGSFLPAQNFDAALTLPRNSNVVNVIAKANGVPLPIGFPGNCTLVPPNSAGQPAVLCLGANSLLPVAAGAPIEWTVELSNGSILTETVNWTLQH